MKRLVPIATAAVLTVATLVVWGVDRVAPQRLADTLLPPEDTSHGSRGEVFTSDRVVRLDGDRTLLMSYTGAPPGPPPCGSDPVLLAEETGEQVVVLRVQERSEPVESDGPVACTAMGVLRTLSVDLVEPLGLRRVVDAEGADLPVVEVPLLAAPPDGYRQGPESGGDGSYGITYTSEAGGWLTLVVWFSEPRERALAAFERTGGLDVGGEPAELLTMADQQRVIAWRHEGRLLWLSSIGSSADPPLPVELLLETARSVR